MNENLDQLERHALSFFFLHRENLHDTNEIATRCYVITTKHYQT